MFGCNNDRLFPEKYTVKDHISNTKLEKDLGYLLDVNSKIYVKTSWLKRANNRDFKIQRRDGDKNVA